MSGIIILIILILLTLLFLQSVTARISASGDYFHAEIDCSAIKIILDNSKEKKKEKKKAKRKKHMLKAVLSLPPSFNFLLSRTRVTVNSLTVPTRAGTPHEFFARFSLFYSLISLIISLLINGAKELTVSDGALTFSRDLSRANAFSVDFTMVCTLYNLILFGLFFLFEAIKRRIKNARKQNE